MRIGIIDSLKIINRLSMLVKKLWLFFFGKAIFEKKLKKKINEKNFIFIIEKIFLSFMWFW